jgi:hypothetical protein
MGVDFFLYRRKRRKMPMSDIVLPAIEARFASAEYTRFLSLLAHDAEVGEVWDNHQQAISTVSKALAQQVFADFDPERPFGPNKKERRRAKKKERREGKQQPETDHEIESLKQQVEETRKAIEELPGQEPLVEFLLTRMDGGELDGEACRRIGPRIRSIAENWESAPGGSVGWRERALEIADAMAIAAEHPDIVMMLGHTDA